MENLRTMYCISTVVESRTRLILLKGQSVTMSRMIVHCKLVIRVHSTRLWLFDMQAERISKLSTATTEFSS